MTPKDSQEKFSVVHSTQIWLSRTMTWLYTQISCMPPHVENHIVCDKTEHLDEFPIQNLLSADQDPRLWQLINSRSWQVARRRQSYLLRSRVRQSGARIIHSHFGDRGWFNIEDVKRTGTKHVVTFYGYDISRLPQLEPIWQQRYRQLFETADLFLCEGPYLANSLIESGCPTEKVRVHHLGIRLNDIPFRPRHWQPGSPLRVLLAGSFVEKKGMPLAINALGRIRDKTPLEITIIGDDNGQPRSRQEKTRIHEAIDRTGLGSQTRLLGYQPYSVLLDEASHHHVFLSPSLTASDGDSEGGAPVSIIDMAATGMPVVSSRHCDIPEVLEDGVTGLLAAEDDIDGLEERLCWLLDHPERWTGMVEAARRHIENEFSAPDQGQRLAMHYESLLSDD